MLRLGAAPAGTCSGAGVLRAGKLLRAGHAQAAGAAQRPPHAQGRACSGLLRRAHEAAQGCSGGDMLRRRRAQGGWLPAPHTRPRRCPPAPVPASGPPPGGDASPWLARRRRSSPAALAKPERLFSSLADQNVPSAYLEPPLAFVSMGIITYRTSFVNTLSPENRKIRQNWLTHGEGSRGTTLYVPSPCADRPGRSATTFDADGPSPCAGACWCVPNVAADRPCHCRAIALRRSAARPCHRGRSASRTTQPFHKLRVFAAQCAII
jgi:hypothetical protein